MKKARFWKSIRKHEHFNDYVAYLRDRQTGITFENVGTKEEMEEWINEAIEKLRELKPTNEKYV